MDVNSLAQGSIVTVIGLVKKPELNGLRGSIVSAHGDRWAVHLDRGGVPVLVKGICLELLISSRPSTDTHDSKQTYPRLLEVLHHGSITARMCSYIVPVNMERIAASCSSACATMQRSRELYKTRIDFNKEEWIIIDDLNTVTFNRRVGQVINIIPSRSAHGRRRYQVEVDGMKSQERVHTGMQGYMMRAKGSRTVSLPAACFSRTKASVLHVRIHADGPDRECFDETTRELKACDYHCSMSRIVLSQVCLPPGLDKSVDTQCPLMESAVQGIILRPAPFRVEPQSMDQQCWAITQLRTDYSGHPPEQWWDDAGPHTVGWQDGSDFTMEDMMRVWSFFRRCKEIDIETEGRRFSAFNFVPQYKAAGHYWAHHLACTSCKLSDRLLPILQPSGAEPTPGPVAEASDVIELVEHDVPAAAISPEEASNIVHQQWVSQVENWSAPKQQQEVHKVLCHVLSFGRHPQRLDTGLRRSALGRRVEEEGPGLQPDWANGAKVLVPGLTQQTWGEALALMETPIELRPYHALILEQDLEEAMSILDGLAGRRIRLKPATPVLPVPDPAVTELFSISELGESDISSASERWVLDSDGSNHDDGNASSSYIQGEEVLQAWYELYLSMPVRRTFWATPVAPMVSPRSSCTVSAPAVLTADASQGAEIPDEAAGQVNPRQWGGCRR